MSRGVLWDAAGVGNLGSAGREDVKFHDFGRSWRDTPEYDDCSLPFVTELPFVIWAAI